MFSQLFNLFMLSISICFIGTWLFIKFAWKVGLVDKPIHRSAHVVVTPRGGGIAFVFTWVLISIFVLTSATLLMFVACSLFIALIGIVDDKYNLSAKIRLLVQATAGGLFSYILISSSIPELITTQSALWCALVFLFVWSTNTFNFMDGLNGIASLQAIFVLIGLAFLNYQSSLKNETLLAVILIGCLCGFVVWNFPSAKVFMGDVGSGFLGFVLIGMAILSCLGPLGPMALVYAAVLHLIFITDTSFTLIRRIIAKKKWWEAHREHAYQRLVHSRGWSHRKVVGIISCLNIGLGLLVWSHYRGFVSSLFLAALALLVSLSYFGFAEKLAPLSALNHDKPTRI